MNHWFAPLLLLPCSQPTTVAPPVDNPLGATTGARPAAAPLTVQPVAGWPALPSDNAGAAQPSALIAATAAPLLPMAAHRGGAMALATSLGGFFDHAAPAPTILDAAGEGSAGGFNMGAGGGSDGGRGSHDHGGGSGRLPSDGDNHLGPGEAEPPRDWESRIGPFELPATLVYRDEPLNRAASPAQAARGYAGNGAIERVSLKPIIDDFQIGPMVTEGIQLRSTADSVLGPTDSRQPLQRIVWHDHPIHGIAVDDAADVAALVFNRTTAPSGSRLDQKVVVVDIKQRRSSLSPQPRVLHVIEPPANLDAPVSNIRFLGSILRIERVVNDQASLLGYRRHYQFVDLKTMMSYSLEDRLPFKGVLTARAFSDRFYLVAHRGSSDAVRYSVVYFDAERQVVRARQRIDFLQEGAVGRRFLHDPVSERDVFERGEDVWVQAAMYHKALGGWRGHILKLSPGGVSLEANALYDNNGKGAGKPLRVKGAPHTFSIKNGNELAVYSEGSGIELHRWILDTPDVWGNLERVSGGYIARGSNHPSYGFYLLRDNGAVERLTDRRLRLIHDETHGGFIAGETQFNKDDYSVDLVIIPLVPAAR